MPLPRALDLDLEAVTPLWIGGANIQGELRAPPMRGLMRFWLRALLGGAAGETLATISAVESAVFGNTSRASPVAVRLTGAPSIDLVRFDQPELPLGLSYMLWSVLQRDRTAILAGQRFRFRLQSRLLPLTPVTVAGRTLDMPESFHLALTALWLFLRLGGVGARVRRGVGAMRATTTPEGWPETLPPLVSKANAPAELSAELAAGLWQVRQSLAWLQGPAPVEPSSFDLLHENVCQLYLIDKVFPSWWEALAWVGEKYRAFRVDQKADASGVAALLTRGQLAVKTISRAVFGLPIQFFFKSMHAALVAGGMDPREARRKSSAVVSPSRGQARGSPLVFRVIQLAGEGPAKYVVLLGLFRARFLPDKELTIKPNDYTIRPVRVEAPANYTLLERWFDYLQEQQGPLLPIPLRPAAG